MDGTSIFRISSFDSAAFTNPTGVPTINAGRTPCSISLHTVSAAEGALPIAIIAPSSLSLHARKPAEVRVIPYSCAIFAPASSSSTQITSQLCPFLLIPTFTMLISTNMGAPFLIASNPASIGLLLNLMIFATSGSPVAIMQRWRTRSSRVSSPTILRAILRLVMEIAFASCV